MRLLKGLLVLSLLLGSPDVIAGTKLCFLGESGTGTAAKQNFTSCKAQEGALAIVDMGDFDYATSRT